METFNNAEDDILIKLVARFPCVYNPTDPQYRKPYTGLKAWDSIGQQMNKSGKSCKNRWKNIKDTYLRQKRRLDSGLAFVDHPRSRFEEYKLKLSFLDGQPTHCSSTTTSDDMKRIELDIKEDSCGSPEVPNQDSSEPEPDYMTDPKITTITPVVICDSENASDNIAISEVTTIDADQWDFAGYKSTEAPKQQVSKKRTLQSRKKQKMVQKYLQRQSRQKLIRNKCSRSERVDEDDEINLFTRQANSILRKLPSHYQIKAMEEMFGVLTKYKMFATEQSSCSCSKSAVIEVDPLIKTEYIDDQIKFQF